MKTLRGHKMDPEAFDAALERQRVLEAEQKAHPDHYALERCVRCGTARRVRKRWVWGATAYTWKDRCTPCDYEVSAAHHEAQARKNRETARRLRARKARTP